MSAPRWRPVRLLAGSVVLVVLVVEVGAAPFVAGLRSVQPGALLLALLVTAGTTWCSAQRWRIVAAGLGARPPGVGSAVVACYRSQLLNATLPVGVLGDVHRGWRHRLGGGVGTGMRAVAGERGAGMAVQLAMATVASLVLFGAPGLLPVVALVVALGVGARWLTGPVLRVCLLSVAVFVGHALLFVVAARAAGVGLDLVRLVPVALVVLVAGSLPLSVAGWGPREGAAAGVFAATGIGAAEGIAVSVGYGVMALVAVLPGVVALATEGVPVGPAGRSAGG